MMTKRWRSATSHHRRREHVHLVKGMAGDLADLCTVVRKASLSWIIMIGPGAKRRRQAHDLRGWEVVDADTGLNQGQGWRWISALARRRLVIVSDSTRGERDLEALGQRWNP
jgi:hypothetical protein